MRHWLRLLLARTLRFLQPPPLKPNLEALMRENLALRRQSMQAQRREDYMERVAELAEARQMAGAGPWVIGPGTAQETDRILAEASQRFSESDGGTRLREADLPANNGWWGELDLLLDTAEWRREINLSWLEFSRWGIQQIILVSRLYYMKNPLIQRGVNIASVYVFGRGVEVSSPDEAANEVIKDCFERNKMVLGHGALVDQERRKYYDGNLFWVFFADRENTGKVDIRTIDATEIQEIICDPEDSDTPWFYLRSWTMNNLDQVTGKVTPKAEQQWYPALGYEPAERPARMRNFPINWKNPVLHRKVGSVSKWRFGCPIVYAALDWAKTAKKYLEACYTTTQAHAQIAWELTTKGGQAAIAGMKNQLSTTVNAAPGSSIYDTNPTAVNASVFASGPGTTMKPLTTRGAGGDPSEVKEYRNMVGMVIGIPPTWLGDLETANLSTATTLDRPTELGFEEKQEQWREDLLTIIRFVVTVSLGAASGKLREAYGKQAITIREGAMVRKRGRWVQEGKKAPNTIELAVNFPAIREGDIGVQVKAVVESMTLGNSSGLIVGIDAKAGVQKLYQVLDVEGGDEIAEEQYPESEYDPDRTKEPPPEALPAGSPTPKAKPNGSAATQ
jgi:hypothetical protein